MSQRTLVLLKPDTIQKSLIGTVLARLEQKGLKIVGMKMLQMDQALCDAHYADHVTKGFYKFLAGFMMSGPIVAVAIEGHDVVKVVRTMCGATNPADALPGTIRGDFAKNIDNNIIHSSDSDEAGTAEVARFFKENELFNYGRELAA
ncbi:MAG: nucleoside-diphosphate kinase [Candidatus Gracilibacteria bacterium]|nr:nucleoside-diphosphate kinase [Candidatus Gracilibacteria bacterium]